MSNVKTIISNHNKIEICKFQNPLVKKKKNALVIAEKTILAS